MRWHALLALPAALALTGCDGTAPWAGATTSTGEDGRAGLKSDDYPYTILLTVLGDPERHVQDAELYRKAFTEKLGWKGLRVIHKGGHSELYWGQYRSAKRAQKNLRTAHAYRTPGGIALFARAMVIPTPGKDIGPKLWNLRHANGDYSLLVAIFKDQPEQNYVGRRRFAVEYCRRLREHGYEGYFYHGRVSSHVTIGAFGPKSVRVLKTRGKEQLQVLDARITRLQKHFPMLAINGTGVNDIYRDPKTGKPIRVPRRTYLIRIPKGDSGDAP